MILVVSGFSGRWWGLQASEFGLETPGVLVRSLFFFAEFALTLFGLALVLLGLALILLGLALAFFGLAFVLIELAFVLLELAFVLLGLLDLSFRLKSLFFELFVQMGDGSIRLMWTNVAMAGLGVDDPDSAIIL